MKVCKLIMPFITCWVWERCATVGWLVGVDKGYMKSAFWKRVYMSYVYLFSRYLLRKLQRLQLPTLVLLIERKLLKVQKDEAEQCNEDSFNLNMVIRWIVSSWRNKRIKKKRRLMSLRRQSLHLDGLSWKYCVKWTEHINALNSDKNDKKALVTLKDGSKCHNKYLEGLNEINMV